MSVLEQVSDASVKAERPPTYYLLSRREKYVWGRSFTSATGYILSFHGLHRLATAGRLRLNDVDTAIGQGERSLRATVGSRGNSLATDGHDAHGLQPSIAAHRQRLVAHAHHDAVAALRLLDGCQAATGTRACIIYVTARRGNPLSRFLDAQSLERETMNE